MTHKIAVLDRLTLDAGDVSWHPLQKLGELLLFDQLKESDFKKHLSGVPFILSNKVVIGDEHLAVLPALRYIGVLATGYNNIDITTARMRGITVCNIPSYSTFSVAQMVFAYILHFSQHAGYHSALVKEGRWARSPIFCFWEKPLLELSGRVLGIIGYGAIGRQVARIARAFGMKVLVHTRSSFKTDDDQIQAAEREELFSGSDFISLHCPLTDKTRYIINEKTLALMKPEAVLINTGRGGLIDEAALDKALRARRIRAAALDVLGEEPPGERHPLIENSHTLITPHIAWATRQARQRLIDLAAENIRAFLEGKPINRVLS